jgi:hypothetical protein
MKAYVSDAVNVKRHIEKNCIIQTDPFTHEEVVRKINHIQERCWDLKCHKRGIIVNSKIFNHEKIRDRNRFAVQSSTLKV